MGSSQSTPGSSGTMDAKIPLPSVAAPAASNPSPANASRPKPCCVCKDEKAKRDECMLFSNAKNPVDGCKTLVEQYKICMTGYGYDI